MRPEQSIRERFIQSSIGSLTIAAAFQRANIYVKNVDKESSSDLRNFVFSEIQRLSYAYSHPVQEEQHKANIVELSDSISCKYSAILQDGVFRIGIAQKALNLYLKFLWCLDRIPMPPHCPVDALILKKTGNTKIRWTKIKTIVEYQEAITELKKAAGQLPLAKWELEQYVTPNFLLQDTKN